MEHPDASFARDVEILTDSAPAYLARLRGPGQYADVFYEDSYRGSWRLESKSAQPGRNRSGHVEGRVRGTAIHAIGAAQRLYTTLPGALAPGAFRQHMEEAAFAVGTPSAGDASMPPGPVRYGPPLPADAPDRIPAGEKVQLLERLIEAAYSYEASILACTVEYQEHVRRTLVMNTEGAVHTQQEAWIDVRLDVTASAGNQPVNTYATLPAVRRFGELAFGAPEKLAVQAIEQARLLGDARPIAPGRMPVVFAGTARDAAPGPPPDSNAAYGGENYAGQNYAGLWLHEAIGHALEADQLSTEQVQARLGQPIGVDALTLCDTPCDEAPGRLPCTDDEGTRSQRTVLIDRGRLNRLLTDRYWSMKHGIPLTGNGRRKDYRHRPLPRMTGLRLEPGETSLGSILASVPSGLFVRHIQRGFTLPQNDTFYAFVVEGYRIEQGRLTHPVTNVVLKGEGLDVLNQIECVGAEAPAASQRVRCEKQDQVLPVSVSTPPVLVHRMHVLQQDAANALASSRAQ